MKPKQVIIVRTDLGNEFLKNRGKIAAQVAHASLGALLSISDTNKDGVFISFDKHAVQSWLGYKFTKVCLKCDTLEEMLHIQKLAAAHDIPHALITDAGDTVFNGMPTVTCLGLGPAWSDDIDKITGNLKLFR